MTYLEQLTNTRQRSRNMAAGISSMILEIRKENIKQSLSDMETMRHRQDYVATVDGVMYYDDSKAESVNATWFTFENIVKPVIWIAGGNDKGTDFSDLKPSVRKNVRALICLGPNNSNLRNTFKNDIGEIVQADTVETAVELASKMAKKDDIVLFSPACHAHSNGESNEEKGNRYIESVKRLENERNQ